MGLADRDYVRNKTQTVDEQIDAHFRKKESIESEFGEGIRKSVGCVLAGVVIYFVVGFVATKFVIAGSEDLRANEFAIKTQLELGDERALSTMAKSGWKAIVGFVLGLVSYLGALLAVWGVLIFLWTLIGKLTGRFTMS